MFIFGCVCEQAHERLEDVQLQAVGDNNVQLISDILESLNSLAEKDAGAAELTKILCEPHFQVEYSFLFFWGSCHIRIFS